MNNEKGFTLVELLAVIVILGVLTAIAVPSVLGISKKIKTDMYESKKKTVEVALELWADDNKSNCIKEIDNLIIKNLIDGNYLKADDKNNSSFTNPSNGENLYGVKVKKVLDDNNLTSYCKVTNDTVIASLLMSGFTNYGNSSGKITKNGDKNFKAVLNTLGEYRLKLNQNSGNIKSITVQGARIIKDKNNNIKIFANNTAPCKTNTLHIEFNDATSQDITLEVFTSYEDNSSVSSSC